MLKFKPQMTDGLLIQIIMHLKNLPSDQAKDKMSMPVQCSHPCSSGKFYTYRSVLQDIHVHNSCTTGDQKGEFSLKEP